MRVCRRSLTSARSMRVTDWTFEADPFEKRDLFLRIARHCDDGAAVCEEQTGWNGKKTE